MSEPSLAGRVSESPTPRAGTDALPWPPPGLESLHGRLSPVARTLGVASVLVVAPVLWMGNAGAADLEFSVLSFATAAQFIAILLGCALLLATASSLWSIGSRTTSVVHRGYSWTTVLEVLADSDGETGRLIGAESPYGSLGPSTARTLRRMRITRALTGLVAALLPIGMLVALAGSGSASLRVATLTAFGPSLALLAVNSILARLARRPLERLQRERDQVLFQPGARGRVVDPWYAARSRASGDAAIGGNESGPRGGSLWGLAVGGLAGLALLLAVIIVVPLTFVVITGSAYVADMSQHSGRLMMRVAQAERMRPYALAPDTSVAALRAGQALFVLSPFLRTSPRGPELKQPIREIPPLPDPEALFGPGIGTHGGLQQVVLDRAVRGLTAEQRAYLAEVAAHPLWQEYGLVARAARVDLPEAMLELPLSPGISSFDIPGGFLGGATQASHANVSRAAWHLASGRRGDAELALHEAVSFGLRVMDNSHLESDASIGATIVASARTALVRLYEAVGDSAAARAMAALAPESPQGWTPGPRLNERFALNRGLVSPLTPQGVRWELVRLAALASCGNAREILFGPSPDLRRALDSARVLLVRTPAERELFAVFAETVERNALRRQRSPVVALARVPAALLRKPRIYQCAAAW